MDHSFPYCVCLSGKTVSICPSVLTSFSVASLVYTIANNIAHILYINTLYIHWIYTHYIYIYPNMSARSQPDCSRKSFPLNTIYILDLLNLPLTNGYVPQTLRLFFLNLYLKKLILIHEFCPTISN